MSDPLEKLRPAKPTPDDEICACPGELPLKLMQALSANPIHCMNCNLEVRPDGLGLDADTIQLIAHWSGLYDAIDRLWLDSGSYEEWTRSELADISSAVNVLGRKAQRALNPVRRCYYWFFQDESAEDFEPIRVCPACDGPLRSYPDGIFNQGLCDSCSIVLRA